MTRPGRIILGLATLALAAPAVAPAQETREPRGYVNPYIGVFAFDDDELDEIGREANLGPIVGARVGYGLTRAWQIEGAYGFSTFVTEPSEFDDQLEEPEADVDVHLLYGAINWFLGTDQAPTRLLLGAGGGLIAVSPEGSDTEVDPLLSFAVGFTHPIRPWIIFRADVRDHVSFCSAPDAGEATVCLEDEILNNLEFSGGAQFWLW